MARYRDEDKSFFAGLEIDLKVELLPEIKEYAQKVQAPWLEKIESINPRWGISDGKWPLPWSYLTPADKDWIYDFLKDKGEQGIRAQMSSLRKAEDDPDTAGVPNLKVLEAAIRGWLQQNMIDGWVYIREGDDVVPLLITGTSYTPASGSGDNRIEASTSMRGTYIRMNGDVNARGMCHTSWYWEGGDLGKGITVAQLMATQNIMHETPELKAIYDAEMKDFLTKREAAHKQFWGVEMYEAGHDDWWYRRQRADNKIKEEVPKRHKMVCEEDLVAGTGNIVHKRFDGMKVEAPVRPQIRVFDLETHDKGWVYAKNLTPYVYDKTLKDKIILPDLHRDLIDVLTTEMDVVLDDFIEGKSGGTTILCQGGAGLGKTLTAEIYSEIVEKPLYRVHSGQLGVGHAQVESKLKDVLQRGSRWGACVLIDEADVYIRKRGDDLDHNAVVAAFLRTLEYFSGLLFMTTNRSDDVDDAIKSRCIAVISYKPLEGEDSARLWHLILQQFEVEVEADTIDRLVKEFPAIPGRDMKELSKLVAKFTKGRGQFIATYDDFRKLAQFRGLV